jgi:transcription elongation GreA/GreB family factor
MKQTIYLTDVGFTKLREELRWIEKVHLPITQHKLEESRKCGDTKSSDYKKVKDERDFYKSRMFELQNVLETAKLISN